MLPETVCRSIVLNRTRFWVPKCLWLCWVRFQQRPVGPPGALADSRHLLLIFAEQGCWKFSRNDQEEIIWREKIIGSLNHLKEMKPNKMQIFIGSHHVGSGRWKIIPMNWPPIQGTWGALNSNFGFSFTLYILYTLLTLLTPYTHQFSFTLCKSIWIFYKSKSILTILQNASLSLFFKVVQEYCLNICDFQDFSISKMSRMGALTAFGSSKAAGPAR